MVAVRRGHGRGHLRNLLVRRKGPAAGVSGLVTIEDLLEQIVGTSATSTKWRKPSKSRNASRMASGLSPATFPSISFQTSSVSPSSWARPTMPLPSAAW